MNTSARIALILLLSLACARPSQQQTCSGIYVQNLPFNGAQTGAAKVWKFTDKSKMVQQVGFPIGPTACRGRK